METIGTWWMWAGFAVFVVVAIAIDLLVMERQGAHKVTMKEAVRWSLLWFSLAFVFVAILWWYLDGSQGREVANTVSMQFITGYLVEKSLSIDNIFVFLMLFSYFAVPPQYQKRALIIGAEKLSTVTDWTDHGWVIGIDWEAPVLARWAGAVRDAIDRLAEVMRDQYTVTQDGTTVWEIGSGA